MKNEADAMKHMVGYVAKDRDTESLCLNASIKDNIAVGGLDNSISEIQGFVGDGDQLEGGFCMSDSGKQVYVVYKSEFAYSSEYGKGGTFTQVKLNDFITIISKPRGGEDHM